MTHVNSRYRSRVAIVLLLLGCGLAVNAMDFTLKMRIDQANHYLIEFEKEVARERGGEKQVWRCKRDALDRVRALVKNHPNEPAVQALFDRAQKALMRSKGEISEVNPEWTRYKRNEEDLRKMVWAASQARWNALLAAAGTSLIARPFPIPDPKTVDVAEMRGRFVVLDVQYPACQFYGGTGEYVFTGTPSQGFYYVAIGGRDWLGPYEAVKRYRDMVDSSLVEVKNWKMLGRITDVTMEYPDPNPHKRGGLHMGWVVTPVALMVPDHVVAEHRPDAAQAGVFVAEDKIRAAKEGWYTVKSIPADVTPERLMEIFMTAIKEKNFRLFCECIDPRRRTGFSGDDLDVATDRPKSRGMETAFWLVNYHWQLHQHRFQSQYVHATFSKARIVTLSGFNEKDADEDFFLTKDQKAKLKKASGDLVERAYVDSRAIDANGKQLGSPHEHRLIRTNGGRWYVEDYAPRF